MDEDATCLLPTPGYLLDEGSEAAERRLEALYTRGGAAAPRVGIKSVGETYFGDTQAPKSLSGNERRSSAATPELLKCQRSGRPYAEEGPLRKGRERSPKGPSTGDETKGKTLGSLGDLRARCPRVLRGARAKGGLLVAGGMLVSLAVLSWVVFRGSPSDPERAHAEERVPAPVEERPLESPRLHSPPRVDPEEGLEAWSLETDETATARRAADALLSGNCGGALEAYQRLVNQEGPRGRRWEPFLLQTRRRCLQGEERE